MKIGVVADDITGSNDIGICFVNGGASVAIYTYAEGLDLSNADTDVVIIDTDSRFDTEKESYDKVYSATETLEAWGADLFHNKTCSVFRGNIGAEFDAMQDCLSIHKSMVVLGFPKNGRTTIDGIHYVNGVELKDTQFKNDPIHPMRVSGLREILSSQTKRPVHVVSYREYHDMNKLLARIENSTGYLVFDVRDDSDLSFLADCLRREKNICGSSAIAEYLPEACGIKKTASTKRHVYTDHYGVLTVAGSLTPQTASQIAYAKQYMKYVKVDTIALMERNDEAYQKRIIVEAVDAIRVGSNFLIHTANESEEVEDTKKAAIRNGMNDKTAGKLISGFLAEITDRILSQCGAGRFISLGGDTSAALSRKLGINKMYVLEEIEAGVPTLIGGENNRFLFTLKSGSFGSEDFIMKAISKMGV